MNRSGDHELQANMWAYVMFLQITQILDSIRIRRFEIMKFKFLSQIHQICLDDKDNKEFEIKENQPFTFQEQNEITHHYLTNPFTSSPIST